MRTVFPWISPIVLGLVAAAIAPQASLATPQPLTVVYPPNKHSTTADRIFLIGSADPADQVLVNGRVIPRSAAGHFAPSFPLQLGDNRFEIRDSQGKSIDLVVTRTAMQPTISPSGVATDSLFPAVDVGRLPGEQVCFSAIAAPEAAVSVQIAGQTIRLQRQTQLALPENSGVLTGKTAPIAASNQYIGCTQFNNVGSLGQAQYEVQYHNQRSQISAPGKLEILSPTQPQTIAVTAEAGVARTGPSTDYSRLTPLPTGTEASVTGFDGDWWRLDYGGWIRKSETQTLPGQTPIHSIIRGITSRDRRDWTEVIFPLQVPVPVSVKQQDDRFVVTLYNVTAQTDTLRLVQNPVIDRIDWQQTQPDRTEYSFKLKSQQQWGYKLRYEGSNLIVSLRHPPSLPSLLPNQVPSHRSLAGVTILLDPGHGGPEDFGSVGLTGLPEKTVALTVAKQLRDRLVQRGAKVVMTREGDVDLLPGDRAAMINQIEPTMAISLHYNALPDDGDALKTRGLSAFWYNPQAQSLAAFLHDYVTQQLDRPSYGVFWNNLALTRPTVAPSILLELGFMINPEEFEWIRNPQAQAQLADTLADGITLWLTRQTSKN